MVKVATPLAFTAAVPIMVDPLRKATGRRGTPALPLFGVTVAVKVTLCPLPMVAAEAVNVVLVCTGAGATVIMAGAEIEAESVVLPAYEAVMVCVPEVSAVVLKEAIPRALSVAVPSVAVPSRKVTVPTMVSFQTEEPPSP